MPFSVRLISWFAAFSLLISACFAYPASVCADGIIPSVSAQSAILTDASDGRILYEKNAEVCLPMASTTKIMTAVVAIEYGSLDEAVTIPREATGVEGSSVYLVEGESLTLRELLYAVLLQSANDAATAVAVHIGGSVEGFAVLMNKTAQKLGLSRTHFTNPHGLDDENHYTTAHDLATLTAYALNDGCFSTIASTVKAKISGPDNTVRYLTNHNRLLRTYDGATGVKTGYTKRSGRCLVSSAERDGLRLVAVTLNDGNDWNDHAEMLDFGFEYYEAVTLCTSGEAIITLPCVNGEVARVMCISKETVKVTIPKNRDGVARTVECERFLWKAPENGDTVGYVVFSVGDKAVARVALTASVPQTANKRGGIIGWFLSLFGR